MRKWFCILPNVKVDCSVLPSFANQDFNLKFEISLSNKYQRSLDFKKIVGIKYKWGDFLTFIYITMSGIHRVDDMSYMENSKRWINVCVHHIVYEWMTNKHKRCIWSTSY